MSDLVGNPEDRFSRVAALIKRGYLSSWSSKMIGIELKTNRNNFTVWNFKDDKDSIGSD